MGLYSPSELSSLIKGLRRVKVLVVGDLIIDEYVSCRASHISLEAPIPVFYPVGYDLYLGGASNVAANLADFGAECVLCSIAGVASPAAEIYAAPEDVIGRYRALCEAKGIRLLTIPNPERFFIRKRRYVAQGQHVFRVDYVDERENRAENHTALLQQVREIIEGEGVSAVVLSEMGHGTLTPELIAEILKVAKGRGIPVASDTQTGRLDWLKGSTLISPNAKEARVALRRLRGEIGKQATLEEVAGGLLQDLALEALLVTRAEQGMTLFLAEANRVSAYDIPAAPVVVRDVTGAGDTVIAVMSICLGNGLDFLAAAQIANEAAGQVIQKPGTSTTSKEEVVAALAERERARSKG